MPRALWMVLRRDGLLVIEVERFLLLQLTGSQCGRCWCATGQLPGHHSSGIARDCRRNTEACAHHHRQEAFHVLGDRRLRRDIVSGYPR